MLIFTTRCTEVLVTLEQAQQIETKMEKPRP